MTGSGQYSSPLTRLVYCNHRIYILLDASYADRSITRDRMYNALITMCSKSPTIILFVHIITYIIPLLVFCVQYLGVYNIHSNQHFLCPISVLFTHQDIRRRALGQTLPFPQVVAKSDVKLRKMS